MQPLGTVKIEDWDKSKIFALFGQFGPSTLWTEKGNDWLFKNPQNVLVFDWELYGRKQVCKNSEKKPRKKTLALGMNQYQQHILDCQDSNFRVTVNNLCVKCTSGNVRWLWDVLMEEIKPVVTEIHDLGHWVIFFNEHFLLHMKILTKKVLMQGQSKIIFDCINFNKCKVFHWVPDGKKAVVM